MPDDKTYDTVVIGGGPSGAAAGRLLASWGHSVCILHKPADRSRGLGESVPPSTRKILATIGVLDAVERAGFFRTTGNTVWWASGATRIEPFDAGQVGFQVFRPDFDDLLLNEAEAAGTDVHRTAFVRKVDVRKELTAHIDYEDNGCASRVSCRFVLDCSGRSGVLAKSHRRIEPSYRMYAIVGAWCRPAGWSVPDETHTLVETYEDGWAWSVPLSPTMRHVGAMVDGTSPRVTSGRGLTAAYRAEITKAAQLSRAFSQADLKHVWACDAALYSSNLYAGPRFLLVGDAGSFIDPLSSFGVKKALASAWLASIVVHTCLTHPERQTMALDFFSQWEQDVYDTHLRRSRDFARAAHARHPHPFWARRAETAVAPADAVTDGDFLRDPAVHTALDTLRRAPAIDLMMADDIRVEEQAVIRGREIVREDAFVLAGGPLRHSSGHPDEAPPSAAQPFPRSFPDVADRSAERGGGGAAAIRFLDNVDLLSLARIACQYTQIPDVFAAYCRTHGPVPLPGLLGALSFLVARGILRPKV